MIVYGDRTTRVRSRDRIADIADAAEAAEALPPGIVRHGAIADAFIALGQVVQGVADADRERIGADGGSAAEAALIGVLVDLAGALTRSWSAMTQAAPAEGDARGTMVPAAASRLRSTLLEDEIAETVELRLPEGYAFYALYPEAYVVAARRLELAGPPRVIGIRSIGTGLAAIVAAALGAPAPLTVRPVGHPFDRHIELTEEAEAGLIDAASHYVVVDEGPGLSGSSFAAVAGFLETRGVPANRIAFLPSHTGDPGGQASEQARARWIAAQRPVVPFDELIPPERLTSWIEPLIGAIDGAIEDLSGGGWRARAFASEAEWPAVDPGQERRKFLVRAGSARWLVKFAGLGGEAARKAERGRILHAAGMVPEVRGHVHGFLVQRWVDAVPLTPAAPDIVQFAARYLGARSRLLPPGGQGASIADLFAMARHNIGLALGEAAARCFADRYPDLNRFQKASRPIATDNRCQPHEWLRLADGRIVKGDALDHDAAHDLIGAQDLAWDVAGVSTEFDLDAAAMEGFACATERAAVRPVPRRLLAFLAPCYLAFRLGAAQMAADALGGWPAEEARNRAAVTRHAAKLAALLRLRP